jgi:cysteine-rich repeat protein
MKIKVLVLFLFAFVFVVSLVSGVSALCGNGVINMGEQCDDGNLVNGDGCSSICINEPDACDGADYVFNFNPKMLVVGHGCHPAQKVDSRVLNVPVAGDYNVIATSVRGHLLSPGVILCKPQSHEDYFLEANSATSLTSLDNQALNPCDYEVRTENLGPLPFVSGSNTLKMHTAAQCPPHSTPNSVEVKRVCLFLAGGPECGDGVVDAGEQCDDGNNFDGDGCSAQCEIEDFKVVVHKIVCENEGDLPNYGKQGGPDITSTTAVNFVGSHAECEFEEGWNFQWAAGNKANPGDEVGDGGAGWITFGPTDGSGMTMINITKTPGLNLVWIREVFKSGYLEFSGGASDNDVTAEIYCHQDVLNFDNYDKIDSPLPGMTFYCVAWNVLEREPECGDGVVDAGEQCDDGNNDDFDSCRNDCTLPECGDGVVDAGEQCDDGNNVDDDFCNNQCEIVEGEYCDDQMIIDFDDRSTGEWITNQYLGLGVEVSAINKHLSNHPDKAIIFNSSFPSVPDDIDLGTPNEAFGGPGVGIGVNAGKDNALKLHNLLIIAENDIDTSPADGFVDAPDDENAGGEFIFNFTSGVTIHELFIVDIDRPNSEMRVYDSGGGLIFTEPIFAVGDNSLQKIIRTDTNYSARSLVVDLENSGAIDRLVFCPADEPVCGDGVLDAGEQCDDGNNIDGDGCQADCTLTLCGDGVLDAGEQCDDGANGDDSDGCYDDCTLTLCGDGVVQNPNGFGEFEQCDDGNNDDFDSCRNDCTLPECGDGVLDAGEECDDGNNNNNDACRNDCSAPFCGDGILDAGEQCDDGNNDDLDGCDSECKHEDDHFEFCALYSCGPECFYADFGGDESEKEFPEDCKVVVPLRNGVEQQPICVPTEIGPMCFS